MKTTTRIALCLGLILAGLAIVRMFVQLHDMLLSLFEVYGFPLRLFVLIDGLSVVALVAHILDCRKKHKCLKDEDKEIIRYALDFLVPFNIIFAVTATTILGVGIIIGMIAGGLVFVSDVLLIDFIFAILQNPTDNS